MEHSSSRKGKVAIELDAELLRKVKEIERLLDYTFTDKSLLVEAITHGSYAGHPSYQRLEFVGDAVLGLAVANYLYERYPDIGSGKLTDLRRANVSNEKLARVAVRLGLYRFLRRNSPGLDRAVSEFTDLVMMEEEEDYGRISYGGSTLKARTILADMVESIAAAVYWDSDRDLKSVWKELGEDFRKDSAAIHHVGHHERATCGASPQALSEAGQSSGASPIMSRFFVHGACHCRWQGYGHWIREARGNRNAKRCPRCAAKAFWRGACYFERR